MATAGLAADALYLSPAGGSSNLGVFDPLKRSNHSIRNLNTPRFGEFIFYMSPSNRTVNPFVEWPYKRPLICFDYASPI